MTNNFYSSFFNVVKRFPKKIALEFHDISISYLELDKSVRSLENGLMELGLRKGDRIIVSIEKSLEYIYLYLSCLKSGVIFIPLNPDYSDSEFDYFIDDCDPKIIVLDKKTNRQIKHNKVLVTDLSLNKDIPIIDGTSVVKEQEPAVFIYTSGTTGKSKAAVISQNNILKNAADLIERWKISSFDTLLHVLPLFHVHGLFVGLNIILLSGGTIFIKRNFSIEETMDKLSKCSLFMGVPTIYKRLADSDRLNAENTNNIRLLISGSAPMSVDLHEKIYSKTGHKILERYGMSEAGMITSNYIDKKKIGTVGTSLDSVEVRVMSDSEKIIAKNIVGNIEIKGHSVFRGYWNQPEENKKSFTKDGWFKTGDMGYLDEDNFLTISGRSKELIITGGYNVYPKEVEDVLMQFQKVHDCAVVGRNDHDLGEVIIAYIVLKENTDMDNLFTYLKARLVKYKIPKEIIKVEKIPRNAMGKIVRSDLK
jgi:malonyl-CoA/methylmalonyl-CoA synthetase